MSDDRFPSRVRKTGCGWDEARSAYKVQIGTQERTIAYAWVPAGFGSNDGCISEAVEIANRMIEGWNAHPRNTTQDHIADDAKGVLAQEQST